MPDYDNPPLVEVAVAVAFRPIVKLRTVELGLLWDSRFRTEFPLVEEQARVEMPVETFETPREGPTFSLELAQMAPPPRLWLRDEPGTHLVQLQNDWLARNWRKMESAASYPRYPSLKGPFAKDIAKVQAFLAENDLGELVPTQCEITYINHVSPLAEHEPARLDEIMAFRTKPLGRLPKPESVRLAARYVLSHGGSQVGRIHVSAEPAVRRTDGLPVTVLTLTARGRPLGKGVKGVMSFLDFGHEWLVQAFEELTLPEAQRAWGKRRVD